MKSTIRNIVRFFIKYDIIWGLFVPLIWLSKYLSIQRQLALKKSIDSSPPERKIAKQKANQLFKDYQVLNGPFKGLKYPKLEAVGSEIYPKLLGSYEMELHDFFEERTNQKYVNVLDIGCAEGFYAVGMLMRHPEAHVFGYDIDQNALNLCQLMAELNQVESRLHLSNICTSETLMAFPFSDADLIICDCEGFEIELFTPEVIKLLYNCELLVELHDFYDPLTSQIIMERFEATHDMEVIESVDDHLKTKKYNFTELKDCEYYTKWFILSEKRPSIMEWLILTPKNNS